MLLPADSEAFGTGRAPDGQLGCPFFIRRSTLDKIIEHGPQWKYHSVKLIPGVLTEPTAIFEGLGRDGCLASCCYCGLPAMRFVNSDVPKEPHKGYFFVVYVEPISSGYVVCDWGWRAEDTKKPGYPTAWESFEKGKVWPKP